MQPWHQISEWITVTTVGCQLGARISLVDNDTGPWIH